MLIGRGAWGLCPWLVVTEYLLDTGQGSVPARLCTGEFGEQHTGFRKYSCRP